MLSSDASNNVFFIMSDAENENSLTLELDYDLWEGQFEFVGPTDDENCQPQGLLKPPPFLANGTNGAKKTAAHRWCENVTDQVSACNNEID